MSDCGVLNNGKLGSDVRTDLVRKNRCPSPSSIPLYVDNPMTVWDEQACILRWSNEITVDLFFFESARCHILITLLTNDLGSEAV